MEALRSTVSALKRKEFGIVFIQNIASKCQFRILDSRSFISIPFQLETGDEEEYEAAPTDGLWDDGRTDEGQLGFKYEDLEDAMRNPNSRHKEEYEKIRKQNLHKMEPIPVCKIPS